MYNKKRLCKIKCPPIGGFKCMHHKKLSPFLSFYSIFPKLIDLIDLCCSIVWFVLWLVLFCVQDVDEYLVPHQHDDLYSLLNQLDQKSIGQYLVPHQHDDLYSLLNQTDQKSKGQYLVLQKMGDGRGGGRSEKCFIIL